MRSAIEGNPSFHHDDNNGLIAAVQWRMTDDRRESEKSFQVSMNTSQKGHQLGSVCNPAHCSSSP